MRAGARHEQPQEWGSAHFLEHLLFRGAGPWNSARIADLMDRVGGDVNAFTTRDFTCYHAHVLDADLRATFDLLWTLVTCPHLAPDDLERERGVVREEFREAMDDAEDRAEQAFMESLWGSHPVAHDVLGTATSIEQLTASTLHEFWERLYVPQNVVVVLAGSTATDLWPYVRDQVAMWQNASPSGNVLTPPSPHGGFKRVRIPGDQAYVVVGMPAVSLGHPSEQPTRLLAIALGGQNSSRLWQRIREQNGLAYHVGATYSAQWDYADLTFAAGVAPTQVERVVSEMGEEWERLSEAAITAEELDRARIQLRAGLVFGMETPEGRMHRLARWALAGQDPPSLSEELAAIQAVSVDDIAGVVNSLKAISRHHLAGAVAGPRPSLFTAIPELFTHPRGG